MTTQLEKSGLSYQKIHFMFEQAYNANFDYPLLKANYKKQFGVSLIDTKRYPNEIYLYFDFGAVKKTKGKYFLKLKDSYIPKHYVDGNIEDGDVCQVVGGEVVKNKWEEVIGKVNVYGCNS